MWARRGVPLREQLYAGRGELWAPDRCPGCRPSASRPWPDMVQGLGRLGRKRDPVERLRPAATSVTNRQRDQQLSALSVNASGQLQPLPPACAAARHSYAAGEGEAGGDGLDATARAKGLHAYTRGPWRRVRERSDLRGAHARAPPRHRLPNWRQYQDRARPAALPPAELHQSPSCQLPCSSNAAQLAS